MVNTEEKKEEEKKYPSLILGLDISTSCIGISIIEDDGVNEPVISRITHIVPKIAKEKKGIEALILRKEIFERDFLSKIKDVGITECVIESPICHTASNSNAQTVAQLLQFNGLLSEAVYRVLGIIPHYVSSYEARMQSFPNLLAIRKFNKRGELYQIKHIEKALKESHLILFGSYPFDCDKKSVMMDMVCEKYPEIQWVHNKKGEIRKENYDACDSLVCALAYVNTKRYGEMDAKIKEYNITQCLDFSYLVEYTMEVWGKEYQKKMVIPAPQTK
jgi:hypothetical protein